MTHNSARSEGTFAIHCLYSSLVAFPISCFSLTVLTDIAYWRTLNLLWLHFSEWLLLAGLVFGILAAIVRVGDLLVRKASPAWPAVIGAIIVLLLAALNSFIHAADGWTAVMPYGLAVSILTVGAMIVTAWFARCEVRHV